MYRGENTGHIDIHHVAKQRTTTIKAVINAILASNITNDCCGARKIFLHDRYACPDLFSIIFEEMDSIGGGTCKKNRICLPGNDERLTLPKVAERGTYRRLYNRCFHIVDTRRKDSKTLQFIRSLMKIGITEVSRRRGQGVNHVVCPEDLTEYHHNMDGVDWGDQLQEHGAGFSSKAHF